MMIVVEQQRTEDRNAAQQYRNRDRVAGHRSACRYKDSPMKALRPIPKIVRARPVATWLVIRRQGQARRRSSDVSHAGDDGGEDAEIGVAGDHGGDEPGHRRRSASCPRYAQVEDAGLLGRPAHRLRCKDERCPGANRAPTRYGQGGIKIRPSVLGLLD